MKDKKKQTLATSNAINVADNGIKPYIFNENAASEIAHTLYDNIIKQKCYFLKTLGQGLYNLKNGYGNSLKIKYLVDRLTPVSLGADSIVKPNQYFKPNKYSATVLSTDIDATKNFLELRVDIDDYDYTLNMSREEIVRHFIKDSVNSLCVGIENIFSESLKQSNPYVANILPRIEDNSVELMSKWSEWHTSWQSLYEDFQMPPAVFMTPDTISKRVVFAGEQYLSLMQTNKYYMASNNVLYSNLLQDITFNYHDLEQVESPLISKTNVYNLDNYESSNYKVIQSQGIVFKPIGGIIEKDDTLILKCTMQLPADSAASNYTITLTKGSIIATNLYIKPQIYDNNANEVNTLQSYVPLNFVVAADIVNAECYQRNSVKVYIEIYKPKGINPKDLVRTKDGNSYRTDEWEKLFRVDKGVYLTTPFTKQDLLDYKKDIKTKNGYILSYMQYTKNAIQAKFLVPYLEQRLKEKTKIENVPFVIEEETADLEFETRTFKFKGGAVYCADPRYMCRIPVFFG